MIRSIDDKPMTEDQKQAYAERQKALAEINKKLQDLATQLKGNKAYLRLVTDFLFIKYAVDSPLAANAPAELLRYREGIRAAYLDFKTLLLDSDNTLRGPTLYVPGGGGNLAN